MTLHRCILGAAALALSVAAQADPVAAQTGTAPPGAAPAAETPADPTAAPGIAIPGTGLTLTTTAAVANDYLFRGISQTRNNWAVQGTFDLAHESGVYVGAFLTNAKFLASPWNDTRQELDLLAGYRFALGRVNVDIGYVGYLYPGQDKAPGTQLNEYHEVAIRANTTIDPVKILAAYNYSPNFFGRSGTGHYVEGGVDVTLPYAFTASGRLGYQWIQNNPRFGTPDYLWYSVGLSHEIYWGVTATLSWYGTNIGKRDCAPVADRATGGQRICEGRVLFTLSKVF
ncbi:MAG: hypothetical protein IRY90_19130 [Actinomadura rubrobrunea]|nr:hypothetical protein [Actinomadura rubrobrunea]